jgi:hypothetical protein
MPDPDWSQIAQNALLAAKQSLGQSWSTVQPATQHSVQLLVTTAEYIAANEDSLSEDERNLIITNQKLAMQNVLLGYEAIGIVAAEEAVDAAWGVVSSALSKVIGAFL